MRVYTLNDAGIAAVRDAVAAAVRAGLVEDMSPPELERWWAAWYADAERAADSSDDFTQAAIVEISGVYTRTGNPVTFSVDEDHFDGRDVGE